MSSAAQIKANRANAQHSTGPRTEEGQTASKANAVSHGLRSSRETLFAAHPQEQDAYNLLSESLRADLFPTGPAEELVFDAYTFASFQVQSWSSGISSLLRLACCHQASMARRSSVERVLDSTT